MDKSHDIVPQKPEIIPEDIRQLISEEIGKKVVTTVSLEIAERFVGPVPHPRILKEYAIIMPDAPERIFNMAEKQHAHRIDLEKSVIKGDIKRADTGLVLGFVLFMVIGIGAIILLAIGKDVGGYALLATSLVGGIGNFIRVGRERARIKREPTQKEISTKTTDGGTKASTRNRNKKSKRKR
jgi:uncharacterized membrane protein